MGLDTSHGAWSGGYGSFNNWREQIAETAGFPPLELMEGFYAPNHNPFILVDNLLKNNSAPYSYETLKKRLPIKWDFFKQHPLYELLSHSDCDGDISPEECKRIADGLTELLPLLPDGEGGGHIGNWREKTQTFIDGCMEAYNAKEHLLFQ
jgi:hypothetical protein